MSPHEAYDKARNAKKRLPELEHIVLTDSWYSYLYSERVIKGRWIEAEDIIVNNTSYSYMYARHVTKGKLPEKMHNMMILHAIEEPNLYAVKQYFEYAIKHPNSWAKL